MVSAERIRRLALALPAAAEQDHHGRPSFRVAGRIFATLWDEGHMNVMLDEPGIQTAVQGNPDACEELWWGKRLRAVQVRLDRADEALVAELLADSWEQKAPKRLLREWSGARDDGAQRAHADPRSDPRSDPPLVRSASERDAVACAAIYAPYVTDTAITFETDPPSPAQMAERIAAASRSHAWLVLEEDARVVGYAYGAPHKTRAAYRWACEVSVYLEPGRRRTGGGRALYDALLTRLTERGFRVAVAGMTLPNEASMGLHRALGFEPVGTYRRIGFKHGSWHDVAWTQRILAGGEDPPAEPT